MKTNPDLAHLETHTPRIIALILLAACLLLVLANCGAQTTNAPAATVFALSSVDGRTLPCILKHEGTTMTVQAGTFTLASDGSCGTSTTIVVGTNKAVTLVRRATYVRSGSELAMKWKGFGRTQGTLAGDDFTMNNEGMIFAYHKPAR